MLILTPLARRPVATLWCGLTLSAIGDELYKVAMIWLAVRLAGARAPYLSAAEAAAVLAVGLLGGVWADRWDHRRTMIAADVGRGAATLVPVVVLTLGPPSLAALILPAMVVAGLRGFFEPALQASLPRLVPARDLLQATNALFDATPRVARLAGPALAGLLGAFMPIVHFFTLSAVGSLASGAAIATLRRALPPPAPAARRRPPGALAGLTAGAVALRAQPVLRYCVWASGINNAAWVLAVPLGVALALGAREGVASYAIVLASYGLTNLAANVVVGSAPLRRPVPLMFAGNVVVGLGIVGIAAAVAYAPAGWRVPAMMAGAGFGAIGGPMSDIPMATLTQIGFRRREIAPVYRLKLSVVWGAILVAGLIAPRLFEALGTGTVMLLCGAVIVATGATGLATFARVATIRPASDEAADRPAAG